MRFEYIINPRKIGLILGIIAFFLAFQSIIAEYVVETKLNSETHDVLIVLLDTLSVNAEQTIPTWYAVTILLVASALLTVIALAKRANKDRHTLYWIGLASLFLYLSMDEGAAIHEILADPLQKAFNTSGYLAFGWQIVAVPLVIIFGLLYLHFLTYLPSRIRNLFCLAGAIYIGGALVVEGISANQWYVDSGITLTYLVIGTIEELFEMLGVVVFIYALLLYMFENQYAFTFRPQPIAQYALLEGEALIQHSLVMPAQSTGYPKGIVYRLLRVHPSLLVIVFLLVTNVTLLYWVLTQVPTVNPASTGSVPFYNSIADQLHSNGVTVIEMTVTFSPDNLTSRQVVASLLSLFDNVMVVTWPLAEKSIVFAGDTLLFNQYSLTELLRANGQTQFIVFNTLAVKTIVGNLQFLRPDF